MAGEWPRVQVSKLIEEGELLINDGYRAKNSELSSTGLPFARAQNVNNGFRFDEEVDRFPEKDLHKVGVKVSQPGDVVFTSKGTVGRFAYVRTDTPSFVYSPQLCFWRSLNHQKLHPQWLFYWMLSKEFFEQYSGVAGQTDMAEYVSLRDQRRMHITVPPIDRQRAIACILGSLDDKIELNRRMNRTLEEMARAIFKSWFIDFDPVRAKAAVRRQHPKWTDDQVSRAACPKLKPEIARLFPDSFEDSELGEIPKGWRVGCFGDVVKHLRDQENPLLSPGVLFRHFSIPAFDDGQSPKLERGESIRSTKFQVPQNAILLSKINPEIPRVWMVDVQPGDRAICSTEFLVLSALSPFTRSFVYCLALSPFFRQQIEGLVTGTSKSHQRAEVSSILKVAVILPPAPVVQAFTRVADSLLARTLECRRESRTLAALRDALLPKLISGELRVPDAERIAARCA